MTKRHAHGPIEMRHCADIEQLEKVGDFTWGGAPGREVLVVRIPGGADPDKGIVSRWTINHKNHCGAQWSWNGDTDKPTLTPSLHAVNIWHGFVRDGFLVEA